LFLVSLPPRSFDFAQDFACGLRRPAKRLKFVSAQGLQTLRCHQSIPPQLSAHFVRLPSGFVLRSLSFFSFSNSLQDDTLGGASLGRPQNGSTLYSLCKSYVKSC